MVVQGHEVAHFQGLLLGRRYRVLAPLGKGGMATAFRAHDTVFERDVALKLLELDGEHAAALFRREFVRLSGLFHPCLTRVSDFVADSGSGALAYFYTAELVDGPTLAEFALGRRWSD